MPGDSDFQYALLRVVPRLERGEQINAGVVLFARRAGFLEARVGLDLDRLATLAPDIDPGPLTRQLDAFAASVQGEPGQDVGTAGDGLAVMAAVDAARASAAGAGDWQPVRSSR